MARPRLNFDATTATVIDRQAACDQGLKFYFTGRACARGHLAPRYVANGVCYGCAHPVKTLVPDNMSDGRTLLYIPNALKVPAQMTQADYAHLNRWLQESVVSFARAKGYWPAEKPT